MARALHFQENLPVKFWGKCVFIVGYLINGIPSALLNGETPFEMLHGKVPPQTHIKTFGFLSFVHDYPLSQDKFRAWS